MTVRLFLKTYHWRRIDPVPWTPLTKPLSQSRLALVSSAGFVLPGQPPFDESFRGGDPSFREIPADADVRTMVETHRSESFDHTGMGQDPNLAFPLDRVRELAAAGTHRLGQPAPSLLHGLDHRARPADAGHRPACRPPSCGGRGGCGPAGSGLTHVQPDRVSGRRRAGASGDFDRVHPAAAQCGGKSPPPPGVVCPLQARVPARHTRGPCPPARRDRGGPEAPGRPLAEKRPGAPGLFCPPAILSVRQTTV